MNISEKLLNIIENTTISELNDVVKILENKYKINLNLNENYDNNLKNDNKNKKKNLKYSFHLIDYGKNKIAAIKLVKDIDNLNLKDAKSLVESFPIVFKKDLDENSCNILKEKFENIGVKIKIDQYEE